VQGQPVDEGVPVVRLAFAGPCEYGAGCKGLAVKFAPLPDKPGFTPVCAMCARLFKRLKGDKK
jgi:hypothetical protein